MPSLLLLLFSSEQLFKSFQENQEEVGKMFFIFGDEWHHPVVLFSIRENEQYRSNEKVFLFLGQTE